VITPLSSLQGSTWPQRAVPPSVNKPIVVVDLFNFSFNRDLMRARGLAMGQEHVGKGVNIALGPMMNMGRVPNGGRNWEGFGADPFLTGASE